MLGRRNMEEYNKALEVGVQRAVDFAITFSPDKCQFAVEEIEFYGHKFTKDGLKQNSEKISAVKKVAHQNQKKL